MALQGRHLKVGAGEWAPWVYLHEKPDGTLGYSGLVATYFDIIAQKLNFTYSIYAPADKEFGRLLPNGSFTGLIGMCQKKEVDVVLGPVALKYDRFQVADYSVPVYIDQYRLFLPRPRLQSDLSSVTRPFAEEAWMALGIIFFGSLALVLAINYLFGAKWNTGLRPGKDRKDTIVEPSSLFRVIAGEVVQCLPESDSGRVFLITWMLSSFILQAAYSGALTSILAVPKLNIPVDSLEDLLSYGKIPWILKKGSSLHNAMSKAKTGISKELVDKAIYVSYAREAQDKVKNEGMAMIGDLFALRKKPRRLYQPGLTFQIVSQDFSESGECNFYIGKQLIDTIQLCFGFPKGTELLGSFNKWLEPLKESGIIAYILQGASENATSCLAPIGKSKGRSKLIFSLMDLSGVFLVLAAGATAGLLSFFVELLYASIKSDE